jgi:hypothetical protein
MPGETNAGAPEAPKLCRMSDKSGREQRGGAQAGLCDTCEHQQEVRNTRGSVFSLCKLSRVDPAYPRYPRVPVLSCAGYERRVD